MTKFNELNLSSYSTTYQHIVAVLRCADRPYIKDGESGNYLQDFLMEHGNKEAVPISFKNSGCPRSMSSPIRIL